MKLDLRGKWHLMEPESVVKQLHSNEQNGLDRGEARSRIRRYGRNDLFTIRKRGVGTHFVRLVSDPSLLLCLLVACVAACFSKLQIAIAVWLVLVVSVTASVVISVLTSRQREKMKLYAMPMARVIREGKVYFTAASNLVVGDLILLSAGDIVPADVRILRADGLTVTPVRFENGGLVKDAMVQKRHAAILEAEERNNEPSNLIYGMSEVASGTCTALVVATGRDTRLVASGYTADPFGGAEEPPSLHRIHVFCHRYGTALLISVIPVTLLGLFRVVNANLLDLLLLALALAASCMTEEVVSFAKLVYYQSANDAAKPDKPSDTQIFLNDTAIDLVRKMDEVILVGTAALHDGRMYTVALYAGGKICSGEELGSELADPVLRTAYQFFRGYFLSPSVRDNELSEVMRRDYDGLYTLLHHVGAELETLQLSSGTPYYIPPLDEDADSFGSIRLATESGTLIHHMSTNVEIVRDCSAYRVGNTVLPMTSFALTAAMTSAGIYIRRHSHVLYLYTDIPETGERVFEGFLVFAPAIAKEIPPLLHRFSQRKMNVTLFIGPEQDTAYYAAIAGFEYAHQDISTSKHFRMIVSEDPSRAALLYENQQRANGKRTLAFSVENDSLALIRNADIAVSCDTIRYDEDGFSEKFYVKLSPEGLPNSDRAGQLVRTSSDILIRRSTGSRGGLHSIFAAFETSVSASLHMKAMLRYLACSQFLRAALVLTTLFAGNPIVSAPIILVSGLVVDVFAVLLIAYSRPSELPKPHPRPGMQYSVIAAIVTGVALYFFSMIPEYMGKADAYSGQGCYLFLSVVLTQICMFLVIYRIFCGRFRINALTGGILLFFCTFILRGITLGPIADFMGIGGMNLFRCAFLWCAPLLFLLLSLILQAIFFLIKKK